MNELQVFNYNNREVRTVQKDGGTWWVLKDVCEVLGIAQPVRVAERLDEDEVNQTHIIDSLGRQQNTYIVNESGLYNVILRSDKPEAKNFKRWVTHEVLPSIRKTGSYALTIPKTLPEALRLAADLAEKVDEQKQIIGELKPKADYTDRILKNKGLVTITQIAKDYGMSGKTMNKLLNEYGVQFRGASGQWLLYAKHHAKGYTHSETIDIVRSDGTRDVKIETKWTQKGRLFLYNLLKNRGVLPVIEQEA